MTFHQPISGDDVAVVLNPGLSPDRRRREGWWNMACWNALSAEQQQMLIEKGVLPIGYVADGSCPNGAEVAIETQDDEAPGPRFYCRPCAIAFLSGDAAG